MTVLMTEALDNQQTTTSHYLYEMKDRHDQHNHKHAE